MERNDLYLLDTNVIVHFIRDSKLWRRIRDECESLTRRATPLYSVVSEGELRSLSLQWNWGDRKLDQLEFSLSFFQAQTIDHPQLIRAYAAIDSFSETVGRSMGKNDVWIAATASVTGASLLTTDRDFDHLATRFLKVEWFDPKRQ